jgi:hypothetical protein
MSPEVPDEALGRDGGPRHADAIALGEADETWPRIVEDAARGDLKDIYAPVDESGKERKPSLQPYPAIPWETLNLDQFNFFPRIVRPLLSRVGPHWRSLAHCSDRVRARLVRMVVSFARHRDSSATRSASAQTKHR